MDEVGLRFDLVEDYCFWLLQAQFCMFTCGTSQSVVAGRIGALLIGVEAVIGAARLAKR